MQPTFTHVPPKPQDVPFGEGLTKSAKPTLAPLEAAAEAADSPPEPPPITKKSYLNYCYIDYYQQASEYQEFGVSVLFWRNQNSIWHKITNN